VAVGECVIERSYDPRAIANLMLDEGDRHRRDITHIALQKLLYFAHGLFLIERKRPLVSGYFEAWEFGPVHPAIYQAFKGARDKPITFRATRKNIVAGELTPIATLDAPEVQAHISRIMAQYGGVTSTRPRRSRERTHLCSI
jgi:uncharacterized phage-associated protein